MSNGVFGAELRNPTFSLFTVSSSTIHVLKIQSAVFHGNLSHSLKSHQAPWRTSLSVRRLSPSPLIWAKQVLFISRWKTHAQCHLWKRDQGRRWQIGFSVHAGAQE